MSDNKTSLLSNPFEKPKGVINFGNRDILFNENTNIAWGSKNNIIAFGKNSYASGEGSSVRFYQKILINKGSYWNSNRFRLKQYEYS